MTRAPHTGDWRPLADRMRPQRIEELVGQPHLLGPDKPLRRSLETAAPHSMLLWGPPGSGKTTIARLAAGYWGAELRSLSAVMSGVADIRKMVAEARELAQAGHRTVLLIDEVHRFNKSQQDAFLPHVEDGTVIFIGATTENPSFELNSALVSRARVYVLRAMDAEAIDTMLARALSDTERGLGAQALSLSAEQRRRIAEAADGDTRRALNFLEMVADLATTGDDTGTVTGAVEDTLIAEVIKGGAARFDKGGDAFYDQISAVHKSIRSSDPDATLYWLARMLQGGCDPLYAARRLTRIASEDIGNADPRALQLALSAWQTYERLGSPEGELALAHLAAYLAVAPKSNRVYAAWQAAWADAERRGSLPVPEHLRNAPTKLMKELGHGKGYRYDHDEPDAIAAGQACMPEAMPAEPRYYEPSDRGLEARIGERLEERRRRRRQARGDERTG